MSEDSIKENRILRENFNKRNTGLKHKNYKTLSMNIKEYLHMERVISHFGRHIRKDASSL